MPDDLPKDPEVDTINPSNDGLEVETVEPELKDLYGLMSINSNETFVDEVGMARKTNNT